MSTQTRPAMPQLIDSFVRFEKRFHDALLRISGFGLAAISCISFYQILARFVLAMPNSWTEVLARTVMIWMIFLALPAVFSNGSLVAFDFFARALRGKTRQGLTVLIGVINLYTLAVILWFGVRMADRVSGQAMAGLEFLNASMAWGYSALPAGALLAIPGVLAWLAKSLYAEQS